MNDKDTILVDRIRELEDKLSDLQTTNKELQKKLRQPIRIVKSFQDLWTWWWRTEERQALTVASVLLFCIITLFAWFFGGWTTNSFYIDYDAGTPHIYQEISWGRDRRVADCYKEELAECAAKLKREQAAWKKYKELQNVD